MTGQQHAILAFVIGLVLPLGYGLMLWFAGRKLRRRGG